MPFTGFNSSHWRISAGSGRMARNNPLQQSPRVGISSPEAAIIYGFRELGGAAPMPIAGKETSSLISAAKMRSNGWTDRREPRTKDLIRASMRAGGPRAEICIRDISRRGLLVQAPRVPSRGTIVEIALPGYSFAGQVVWAKDRRFGIACELLSLDRILHPHERAAVGSFKPEARSIQRPGLRPDRPLVPIFRGGFSLHPSLSSEWLAPSWPPLPSTPNLQAWQMKSCMPWMQAVDTIRNQVASRCKRRYAD